MSVLFLSFQYLSFIDTKSLSLKLPSTGWNDTIVTLEKTTWFHFPLMKTGFLRLLQTIYYLASCVQIPRAIGAFMSESDTMFNERDRRCAAVQLMLYTDPRSDNRTIASTLKMQIWIATNNRGRAQGDEKQSFRLRLWSLVWFQVRATSCHLTSSKSAWKSTSKCTWMCWRAWWSPGAIRWPVADPVCGSRTRRRPTSPKISRLGFKRSATTLYPFLTGPPLPPTWTTAGLLRLVIRREHHKHDLPQHQSQPDRRHPQSIRRAPPPLVEKACSEVQICIEAVIETEGGYIEEISSLQHNQVTWIDFFQ